MFYNVDLIQRHVKLMLGTTLYDTQDRIVSQVLFNYTTSSDGQTELSQIHQEVYGTDNAGVGFVTKTDTYIRDLEVKYGFNINN